jgi:hypothetical protein
MVAPTHSTFDGTDSIGKRLTETDVVVLLHPVVPSVNVNVTLPSATPVIKPLLSIVAIDGSLLVQVPPVEGIAFIV